LRFTWSLNGCPPRNNSPLVNRRNPDSRAPNKKQGTTVLPFDWMNKDGKIVLIEKAVRTVPYGFLGVLFSVYLSQLGLNAFLIGVVLALTVASSAIYTLVASVFADRLGRKRTLIFFAFTDALAGALLFSSDSGIVGNMTVGAGEVGPFLTLEQAILPRASNSKRRTLGFSVYNLVGYVSSSAGALVVGLPQYIGPGIGGYRPLFLAYLASGLLGAYLYSKLSIRVEKEKTGSPSISVLSEASKPVVRKLSALFALDSFGGGFIGISILSYYFYERYSLQLSSLGLLFAGTQIITAVSFLIAERCTLIFHRIFCWRPYRLSPRLQSLLVYFSLGNPSLKWTCLLVSHT